MARSIYEYVIYRAPVRFVAKLCQDLQDENYPIGVRSLGRALSRRRFQIAAWHEFHITIGPTESVSNLIKQVRRVVFGFRSFTNHRTHALLYAGKPYWLLLSMIKPLEIQGT